MEDLLLTTCVRHRRIVLFLGTVLRALAPKPDQPPVPAQEHSIGGPSGPHGGSHGLSLYPGTAAQQRSLGEPHSNSGFPGLRRGDRRRTHLGTACAGTFKAGHSPRTPARRNLRAEGRGGATPKGSGSCETFPVKSRRQRPCADYRAGTEAGTAAAPLWAGFVDTPQRGRVPHPGQVMRRRQSHLGVRRVCRGEGHSLP